VILSEPVGPGKGGGATLQVRLGDLQQEAVCYEPATLSAQAHAQYTNGNGRHGHGTLVEAERKHILGSLRDANWVLGGPKGAAACLGVKRSTLHWKMKKLGICRPVSAPAL
jgi:transcriptional regulator with GAF, ATPase, and Fis domain